MIHWRKPAQAGERMMEMIPMPVELVITDADRQAACDLIGNDSYGTPHWSVDTIADENRVVQAFARHRIQTANAQAIEARSAETERLGPTDESAVSTGDAP